MVGSFSGSGQERQTTIAHSPYYWRGLRVPGRSRLFCGLLAETPLQNAWGNTRLQLVSVIKPVAWAVAVVSLPTREWEWQYLLDARCMKFHALSDCCSAAVRTSRPLYRFELHKAGKHGRHKSLHDLAGAQAVRTMHACRKDIDKIQEMLLDIGDRFNSHVASLFCGSQLSINS